jgi:hypothetical protein
MTSLRGFDLKNHSTSLLSLPDFPDSYSGQALHLLQVNASETGVEFTQAPTLLSVTVPSAQDFTLTGGNGGTAIEISGTGDNIGLNTPPTSFPVTALGTFAVNITNSSESLLITSSSAVDLTLEFGPQIQGIQQWAQIRRNSSLSDSDLNIEAWEEVRIESLGTGLIELNSNAQIQNLIVQSGNEFTLTDGIGNTAIEIDNFAPNTRIQLAGGVQDTFSVGVTGNLSVRTDSTKAGNPYLLINGVDGVDDDQLSFGAQGLLLDNLCAIRRPDGTSAMIVECFDNMTFTTEEGRFIFDTNQAMAVAGPVVSISNTGGGANSLLEMNFPTDSIRFVDVDAVGATEQASLEVLRNGVTTGYIRIFATA